MKVPEPRKLKSGTWFIQLRLGGESISVTANTAKDCKQQAALIKARHKAGQHTCSAAPITLSEAIDRYISARSNSLSPSTIRGYRTIQNSYFPNLSKKPLTADINWQAEINILAADHSAKTVKNTWRFICSVLRENKLEPPTVTLPQIVPREHPFLEPEQVLPFVEAIRETDCAIPALLALHSLRRSEIMGLTWEQIDFKQGTIRVSGAAVFDENQKLVRKEENKNSSSVRTVPIMIPALKELLAVVPEKEGYVVTCNPNTIWAQINRTCKKAGFPAVGTHGLRHSFASLAYHLGLSEAETMELGGWSDIQTMRKIYTHLSKRDRIKAQNKIAAFFSGQTATSDGQ